MGTRVVIDLECWVVGIHLDFGNAASGQGMVNKMFDDTHDSGKLGPLNLAFANDLVA